MIPDSLKNQIIIGQILGFFIFVVWPFFTNPWMAGSAITNPLMLALALAGTICFAGSLMLLIFLGADDEINRYIHLYEIDIVFCGVGMAMYAIDLLNATSPGTVIIPEVIIVLIFLTAARWASQRRTLLKTMYGTRLAVA